MKSTDELIAEEETIHIPLWLVWVQERGIGTSLRAIDTKFEYAKRHKAMLENESQDWNKKVRITIEERDANHCYGAGVLSKIFAEMSI